MSEEVKHLMAFYRNFFVESAKAKGDEFEGYFR